VSEDSEDWFDQEFPSEDPFDGDEDFEAAFDLDGEPTDDTGFEEELESDIPRIDVGIAGLDEMILGGVPERSLLVVIGSAGTGKSTFGLQFLKQGLDQDENVVFIALEEDREAVMQAAEEKGWGFEAAAEAGNLAVVDLDPVEMANSLTSIRNDLPRLVREFGAQRLVLDSVSLLEMMYDDQAERRSEIFDFTMSLKQAGVTTMLTSEAKDNNPYASRHGIIEYLTDAVFVLQYVRSEFQETRLAVEIQKIRNANHSRETKPYEITDEGLSVYQQANIF
jgi:KaiC domain protein